MPSFRGHVDTLGLWRRFPALETVDGVDGTVALTFDDGPDPDCTPALLDALDAAGAKATFFMVGEQLMRHHAIAREVAERGHELALHGFEHRDHGTLSPQQARDDLARGLGTLEAGAGRTARWFRPPYGRFSEASYEACEKLGLERVYWSAWGFDWEPVQADRIAEIVTRDLRGGDIVLLHDSPRYAPRESALATAEAIPLIAESGLRLTTLSELAG